MTQHQNASTAEVPALSIRSTDIIRDELSRAAQRFERLTREVELERMGMADALLGLIRAAVDLPSLKQRAELLSVHRLRVLQRARGITRAIAMVQGWAIGQDKASLSGMLGTIVAPYDAMPVEQRLNPRTIMEIHQTVQEHRDALIERLQSLRHTLEVAGMNSLDIERHGDFAELREQCAAIGAISTSLSWLIGREHAAYERLISDDV